MLKITIETETETIAVMTYNNIEIEDMVDERVIIRCMELVVEKFIHVKDGVDLVVINDNTV